MKILRFVSFWGMVFSLVVHLVSWTTPDLFPFAAVGIPLHLLAMMLVVRMYKDKALPLQDNANLQWMRHASSSIHALIFVAILSLLFHTIVAVLRISALAMFLIRALSSSWLYVYTISYGYTSWASRYPSRSRSLQRESTHRIRFRNKADASKSELNVRPPHTFTRYQ